MKFGKKFNEKTMGTKFSFIKRLEHNKKLTNVRRWH